MQSRLKYSHTNNAEVHLNVQTVKHTGIITTNENLPQFEIKNYINRMFKAIIFSCQVILTWFRRCKAKESFKKFQYQKMSDT